MAEEPLQVNLAHCQPIETEQRKKDVFEQLTFGVIYYAAKDNWYIPGGWNHNLGQFQESKFGLIQTIQNVLIHSFLPEEDTKALHSSYI